MRGTILGTHDGRGIVLTTDDRRLEFPLSEWRSAATPLAGQVVDFVEEGGQARAVYIVPGAAGPGVRTHTGSFVLSAFALGSLALGFIIPLLPTIAAFVLGVIAAGQAQAERDESALLMARISWIGALVMMILGFLAILAVILFVGTLGFASIFHWAPMMDF